MNSSAVSVVLHPSFWFAISAALIAYTLYTVIYNRFFHPLAEVPGPFLASISYSYQSYYNAQFFKQIDALHKRYGPIVRITPDEVHLSDPENYDQIFSMTAKYSKSPRFYNALSLPHSTFGTGPNDVHKHKRGLLNPFFSRRTVLQLEEVVQDKARKLVAITQKAIDQNEPVDLHHAFRCVSIDVISDYAFGESYNLLDTPDLGAHFFYMVRGLGPNFYAFQHIPAIHPWVLAIPSRIASVMSPPIGMVLSLQQKSIEQIDAMRARIRDGKLSQREKDTRPTIFTELLDPEKQDGQPVPSTWELKDEVFSLLAAAADTTGNAMTIAAYNVMASPTIYAKLSAELKQAFPDPNAELSFVELEKLTYLTGVIKEGLRLSFGVPGRLSRAVPAGGASFHGYYIPQGYCVGMSSWLMHRNEKVFPDAMRFDPERWTTLEKFREADRGMVPFGRGTRQCVGMPLAYAELYVSIGTLFRKFDGLKVYKTTPWDLEFDDFFSSYHIAGRNWFKAVGPDFEDVKS